MWGVSDHVGLGEDCRPWGICAGKAIEYLEFDGAILWDLRR